MEALTEALKKLKTSSSELSTKCIQEVLILTKKIHRSQENYQVWNEIAEVLWLHLQRGLDKFDDQLLCATCFYSVLHLTDNEELYLNKIKEIVENERHLKETETKSSRTTLAISLMYGMFQSSFLSQTKSCVKHILDVIFKLLTTMAYEYTKFTFIVFKTMSSFKKVLGTKLQEYLFSKENNIVLLNLVNHNWENPITGIRDLNKIIFQTLITLIDDDLFENLLEEVNSFYWNKAKYLMLAEIISKKDVQLHNDWIDGAVRSLSKPGLVSAGTDLYFAILNRCKSEEEWCNVFMEYITDINSTSRKTVQNFSNYWCLTTLKRFPELSKKFMEILENIQDKELKLFNSLNVIKQAHKLGLVIMNEWIQKQGAVKVIDDGLSYCNDQIRIMAFNILCSVNKLRGRHAMVQYYDILFYLKTNINSDNTVLRINMLNSFSNYLNAKQNDLNTFKESEPGELEKEIHEAKRFSKTFQQFVINNLEIQGNYQRKLTNIKLAHIFMNDWTNASKKKKQTREGTVNVIQLLKDENLWLLHNENVMENLLKLLNDPAEDIRDNVVQLLLEHYATQLREVSTFNLLISNALKSMSSKFFYDISCGKSAFKLIINLLLQETHPDGTFQTVTDIYNFACSQIITEHSLNRTIIESIEQGKQLHSYMTILHTVLEECLKHGNKITISNGSAIELLGVLEEISNQFVWDEDTATSSDFSKMSDMINDIIKSSGYKYEGKDETAISGMHQLVLNCLWLNVKAACDLSSMLIKYQNNDTQLNICSKALDIMSHVLETCRHKGAIESAGAALGQSFQHLTSLPEGTEISSLPFVYLKSKLNDLISVTGRMASVTRRGAGLSIMVHRIVSSDMKKGKPLFHYFMNTILETCSQVEDIPKVLNDVQNVENEKDLPKAIYIHFLTRIVTDSSLASDMMFYSTELAELAFGNLTSPHWQIRNAALQLYGALVQKLIGQKKASGTDDETIATVACDELRTHSPKLWAMITKRLQNIDCDDRLQYLSSLVPILNMLANMARRYNFPSDVTVQTQADTDLLRNLIAILDSPIYTVRRLTAKSIFNIYSFDDVYSHLMEQTCFTENYLHGSLMLVAYYHKLHSTESKFEENFAHLNLKYCNIFNGKNHSYLCREIYEDLFYNGEESIKYMEETFVELDGKSHAPGINSWAYRRVQKYLHNSSWDIVPDFLKVILQRDEFDSYCKIFIKKAEKLEKIEKKIVNNILAITLLSERKYSSGVLWKFLYNITLPYTESDLTRFYNLLVNDCSLYLIKNMHNSSLVYNLRYMIPIAAKMCVVDIPKVILLLTDSETTDVEMRLIAAEAITELVAGGFGELEYQHGSDVALQMIIPTLYCLTILLQDEDEDVRKSSAYSLAKFESIRTPVFMQPYVCLLNILQHSFLKWVIGKDSITHFLNLVSDYSTKITKSKTIDKNNPFANNCHNIYFEENVLSQLIEKVKMEQLNTF